VPNHFLGVEGASVSFGKRDAQVRALRGRFAILRAWVRFHLVMGPSGSGKTTLLSPAWAVYCHPMKEPSSWMVSQ